MKTIVLVDRKEEQLVSIHVSFFLFDASPSIEACQTKLYLEFAFRLTKQ